jgi:ribosomal protein S18 acetylase RimI-like enzyme
VPARELALAGAAAPADRDLTGERGMRDHSEAMDLKKLSLRRARAGDARRIWEIRNHPAARRSSVHREAIPFASHETWFAERYLESRDNHCLVLSNDRDEVIGYGRFDHDGEADNYVISIALDADYHGEGVGQHLLKELLKEFQTDKEIVAVVRKDNLPSRSVFEKNDFQRTGGDEENDHLVYRRGR